MTETTDHPLTAWRERSGRSVEAVADELKITRQALNRYENGSRKPKGKVLDRIIILTGGEVDANAWVGKEAAAVVAQRQTSP